MGSMYNDDRIGNVGILSKWSKWQHLILSGKVDKKWTVGHLYRSFHPEESFGFCRIWEKMIFLLNVKVRIDEKAGKEEQRISTEGA